MKNASLFFFLILIVNCNNRISDIENLKFSDQIMLPGIPSDKTFFFSGDSVFYESMDEPGKETIKCFSLQKKKLIWSVPIGNSAINHGTITSEGEYVIPTLSDSVYLINRMGKFRILKLEDRCKINPLTYRHTFIIQDRGVGLRCFNSKSLKEIWRINQKSSFTMSQPLLIGDNLIYILDDESIQASDASSGKLKWKFILEDSLSLHFIYGKFKDAVIVLTVGVNGEKHISSLNYFDGTLMWRVKGDSSLNQFERDMHGRDHTLFFRCNNSIIKLNSLDGTNEGLYEFPSKIVTNIIADRNSNLYCGLISNVLAKISTDDNIEFSDPLDQGINRLFEKGNNYYLYSYPYLYKMQASQKR